MEGTGTSHATPKSAPRPNLTPTVVGGNRKLMHDLHVWALGASWSVVLGLFVGAYVLVNLGFALLYLLAGDVIVGAVPGSFTDAFHFSVQTFSTVGYGQMAPRGIGHVLVTLESAVGVLMVAIATGMMFAKFSRPTAGVEFSQPMVIRRHKGVPTLMFRIANARGNQVIEASVSCVALKDAVSAEGERMRAQHDLTLVRSSTPLFAMSWIVMHPVDATSPLHGLDDDARRRGDVRVAVSFTGLDSTLAQQIHAHRIYLAEDILEGRRFVDILERQGPETRIYLDRLHETEDEAVILERAS
ncbi:MAG: ATP-sensitive inward rectifier potassium channel 10 [Deltaproteobacteria bacterium]|nr:ATP-sensitive inward rectifier potassium channel 10 [Deltaproteobacteria bacterium]